MYKNYRGFTPKIYQLLILFVYPILAVTGCYFLQSGAFGFLNSTGYSFWVSMSILSYSLCGVEIVQDYFIFGGTLDKKNDYVGLLKTSSKGKRVFEHALMFDQLRRFFTIALVYTINIGMGILLFHGTIDGSGLLVTVVNAEITFVLCTIGVIFARFAIFLWLNIAIAYVMNFVTIFMNIFVCAVVPQRVVAAIVFAILDIMVSLLAVKLVLKRLEKSYYD